MKEVAKLQIRDRTELFQATAISMGMQPNVIEKDFWVCFMLDHLFHDCKYKNAFVFKGGTNTDFFEIPIFSKKGWIQATIPAFVRHFECYFKNIINQDYLSCQDTVFR